MKSIKKISRIKILIYTILLLANVVAAQTVDPSNVSYTGSRYLTDEDSNIRMWVNVWGQVNDPGNYLVFYDTDMITLLAMAGGVKEGANLKEIKVFREYPDNNGTTVYTVNMQEFYKTGERNLFLPVLPNDAYYVPQKTSAYLLSKIGILNTVMSGINLYYLALIRSAQAD